MTKMLFTTLYFDNRTKKCGCIYECTRHVSNCL